jgi:hypothetical protein
MVETREFAEEGLNMLQRKIGTTAYLEKCNIVRQEMSERRQDRKVKRAIELVNDPEHAAQKKRRQHIKVSKRLPTRLI